VSLEFNYQHSLVKEHEVEFMKPMVMNAHIMLHDGKGPGSEFTGWVDLTEKYDKNEYEKLKKIGDEIKNKAEVLLVVGIGGSYLGSRAVLEALTHSFYNSVSDKVRKTPQLFFVGNNLSPKYYKDIFDVIKDKEVYVNVISKSGTTTEPAVAFRIIKDYMEETYGKDESKKRIIATTDKEKGALKDLAEKEGYQTFVIPDDIGGRFSVLTPVGLLPLYIVGIDTDKLLQGAHEGAIEYSSPVFKSNKCYQYAAIRQILSKKGKDIELLVSYEPGLQYLGEWWKQLYGESEGKDGKGIFPASVSFTADLHSMGQLIQDGRRNIFETSIIVEPGEEEIVIMENEDDLDGLNYLKGKTLGYLNEKAFQGTLLAHIEGNVPNLFITISKLDEYHIGKLLYFFEKACAISGYIQGVNPFDQPGVEAYKKNMFKLLGKEGF